MYSRQASGKEVIEQMGRYGMKCACDRKITEERSEEALSITDLGRTMLDGSRWMGIALVQTLGELGVPRSSILLEQHVGGDEIDCIADISGERTLFELKDKEFSLGNAYSFGAKTAIVKPKHRIVVTTEHVGGDAREHFNRAKQAESRENRTYYQMYGGGTEATTTDIEYVEGMEPLRPKLTEIVSAIYRSDAVSTLDRVLPLALVSGANVMKALEAQSVPKLPQPHSTALPVPESMPTVIDPRDGD